MSHASAYTKKSTESLLSSGFLCIGRHTANKLACDWSAWQLMRKNGIFMVNISSNGMYIN